jgi:hypothetical protein
MAIEAFVPREEIGAIHLDPLDEGVGATALRRGPAKYQTPQTRKLTQRGS